MCRVFLVPAIVLLMVPAATAAEESLLPSGTVLNSEKEMKAISEKALERLMRGETDGFDLLRAHGVDLGDKEAADRFARSLADRVKVFIRKWGKPLELKPISRQTVGGCLCRYVYLVKYEKNVLRWVFTYYRPGDSWLFFRLDFNDDVNALFEEAEDSDAAVQPRPAVPESQ